MKTDDNSRGYAASRKIFDVSRPGIRPPSATSRPVIDNSPRVKDPDVSIDYNLLDARQKDVLRLDTADDIDAQTEAQLSASSSPGPVPTVSVSNNDMPLDPQSQIPSYLLDEIANDAQPAQPVAIKNSKSTKINPETDPGVPLVGSAAIDGVLDTSSTESYIGQNKVVVSHHKNHRALWLGLILFLLVVVVIVAIINFLLDGGIITTDWDVPHTDFFED